MHITETNIRTIISKIFIKYKLKLYNETKKEFINRISRYRYLILTTNMNFIDIIIDTNKYYNLNINLDQSIKDIFQYSFKRFSEYFKIPEEEIKNRYVDNYEDVEERMFFRIELYKNGWNMEQIEKYIYKYLLKQEYVNHNLHFLECLFYNFISKYDFFIKEKTKKMGRPSLPIIIKNYIKTKLKKKTKEDMRKIYKSSNIYSKIKNKFLTFEELNKLTQLISDKTILEKLQYFTITKN